MLQEHLPNELLLTLAARYEADMAQFVTIPKQILDCAATRMAISELRNNGLVEELVRGVIRLTPAGYDRYKGRPRATVYKN